MELDDLHADMVEQLTKSPEEILASLTPKKIMLLHHAIGMATELGEILTALKAYVIYDKPLDEDNIVEELGDSEFYTAGFRATLGIKREDTLKHNMEKLAKRYPGYRYTDDRAIARADKVLEPPRVDDDYYVFCSKCNKETGHENGICLTCGNDVGARTIEQIDLMGGEFEDHKDYGTPFNPAPPMTSPRRGGFGVDFGPEG